MKNNDRIIAPEWKDYELIDCGGGRKLERFGSVVLDRPEIAADAEAKLSPREWEQQTDSVFAQTSPNEGDWSRPLPPWKITFNGKTRLVFNLQINQFKHIGVFPEQSVNWEYIADILKEKATGGGIRALNLFAYTGGASLAAKAMGADVSHVEALSQLITKAKENMESSGLEHIRWIKEDALKYVHKEVKRGKKYDLVVMDPPSWGRGPKGEQWKLEKQLDELLFSVSQLLNPGAELIINTYSGIGPNQLKDQLDKHVQFKSFEMGELILQANSGAEFSTGSLLRGQVG